MRVNKRASRSRKQTQPGQTEYNRRDGEYTQVHTSLADLSEYMQAHDQVTADDCTTTANIQDRYRCARAVSARQNVVGLSVMPRPLQIYAVIEESELSLLRTRR